MKLRNIVADLKVYSKNYTRAKSALFFAFIFPVIFMLVFGSIFSGPIGGSGSGVTLYVQNLDNNSSLSMEFLSPLENSSALNVVWVSPDTNMTSYVLENSINAALVIPEGFQTAVLTKSNVTLTFYGIASDTTSTIALDIIQNEVIYFNSNGTAFTGGIHLEQTTAGKVESTNYASYLIPGLIGFVILTSPMFSMTYVVSNYKREKIFRQLSLTPLTKSEWYISKFIWYLILSGISALEIMAIGYFAFDMETTLTVLMVPFILAGVFMFTSLGVLSGSVAKTEEGASVIGNIITFPMMFLSGTFFPISIMPGWLQTVAHVLPLYYVIDGLNSVMLYTNLSAAFTDIVIAGVLALVLFIISYLSFNWKEEKRSISRHPSRQQ